MESKHKPVVYSTADLFMPTRAAAKDLITNGTITPLNIDDLKGKIPDRLWNEANRVLNKQKKK